MQYLTLCVVLLVLITACSGNRSENQESSGRKRSSNICCPKGADEIKTEKVLISTERLRKIDLSSLSDLASYRQRINEYVHNYKRKNIVKEIESSKNCVFVDKNSWLDLSREEQEDLAFVSSLYCALERGVSLYWVSIKDVITHEKIAKYVHNRSFK